MTPNLGLGILVFRGQMERREKKGINAWIDMGLFRQVHKVFVLLPQVTLSITDEDHNEASFKCHSFWHVRQPSFCWSCHIRKGGRLRMHAHNTKEISQTPHWGEFIMCRECWKSRAHSVSSRSWVESGPSVFYIEAVTWNPHAVLNFPVKYTTFHVTHTNPEAISLSLNRAESLYLNSFTVEQQCSRSWESSHYS